MYWLIVGLTIGVIIGIVVWEILKIKRVEKAIRDGVPLNIALESLPYAKKALEKENEK